MAGKSTTKGAINGVEAARINGGDPMHVATQRAGRLGVAELERRFRRITALMYDTDVPLSILREEVYPNLAPGVEFVDPWLRVRGLRRYVDGLEGVHRAARLDFDVAQVSVKVNERRDGGRVIVDGTMNVRQLRLYTFPLRTFLTYDFVITGDGERFLITHHEEIWSFGDMLQGAPVVGRWYEALRRASGRAFAALARLSRGDSVRRGEQALRG